MPYFIQTDSDESLLSAMKIAEGMQACPPALSIEAIRSDPEVQQKLEAFKQEYRQSAQAQDMPPMPASLVRTIEETADTARQVLGVNTEFNSESPYTLGEQRSKFNEINTTVTNLPYFYGKIPESNMAALAIHACGASMQMLDLLGHTRSPVDE